MVRRYTAAGVATAISDTDKAKDSETERMLLVYNQQEEEFEIKEVMYNFEEEILAVDFVDEGRKPERTEDDFNEDNEYFLISFASPSGERCVETVQAHSGRRHSAIILRQKGKV